MILVSSMLTSNNYLAWSHSIKIALGVKVELCFINGKCTCPSEGSPDYGQGVRDDCIMTSWILNSIAKDIVEIFLYTFTVKELWDEIQERFGESSEPLFYEL